MPVLPVYVILAVAPFEFATRHSLDHWVRRCTGNRWRFHRSLAETFLIDFISGGLAILFPGSSAKAMTATGALGVGMTSYIIPVVSHYLLYFGNQAPLVTPAFQSERHASNVFCSLCLCWMGVRASHCGVWLEPQQVALHMPNEAWRLSSECRMDV